MLPSEISLIVQAIEAVVKYAPEIAKIAEAAKVWIAAIFQTGAIDAATQDMLNAHVDALVLSAQTGTPPPEWTVEPDPT